MSVLKFFSVFGIDEEDLGTRPENIISFTKFRIRSSEFLGVDSLFKKINCDKSSVRDMLGGVAGVTEGNMMQVNKMY